MLFVLPLQRSWNFRRLDSAAPPAWTTVDLPHSPFVADLDGRDHWFGVCEYERTVQLPPGAPAGRCALAVGAAMHTATVRLDGREVGHHEGGFLPFEVDLTGALGDGRPHTLLLRLDNRDNADIPPGKPYGELDFCWYGGLYRDVELRCYPALHITDPVAAGEVAGGGIFVRTLRLTAEAATVGVRVHMRNAAATAQPCAVDVELWDDERIAARASGPGETLAAGSARHCEFELAVAHPRLWSPAQPARYRVRVLLRGADGAVLDWRETRCGLRRIEFSRSGGLVLNGRRLRPRGTNRHQEYPHAGYAVPPAAQRRDARRIKEAGFDYVRLSHYPQAPEFLDACDELGLLVMNAIPGWQYVGGARFQAACVRHARELVRRDRNHPCVVLWELSLNETAMEDAFMARLHAAGHEEYPGDQMFTCGWIDRYDVFIHSRQHGRIHAWKNGDKALVVAEYGDWEFYAANEGFDQKTGAGVLPLAHNSRKRRADGERGLRRQLENLVVALDDTLGSPAVLDGQWAMFDYARGYDPQRAACGVMDIFRLPKFSYWFYRSQRDAHEAGGHAWEGGAVVFIASHWTPESNLRVLVLSNCDEVELRLNGRSVAGQARNAAAASHLPHPPFFFDVPAFVPGTLEAVGSIAGRPAATHRVATPGAPVRLAVAIDSAGVLPEADEPDLLIVHARLVDAAGTLCADAAAPVTILVEGDAQLLAAPTVEAGIASAVVRVPADSPGFELHATSPGLAAGRATWSRR